MKKLYNLAIDLIVKSVQTLDFIIYLLLFESLKNPFKKMNQERSNRIAILANGPSLKDVIIQIKNNTFEKSNLDFCVVNYIVEDDAFTLLKPQYMVLSDPQFFVENDFRFIERGHAIYHHLRNKVTWNMILFIPALYKMNLKWKEELNDNIKVVFFHSKRYDGILSGGIGNFFFRKGLANGEYGTVALNAIYAMIQIGYKDILLYGLDHNFFNNMAINEQNELCLKIEHYNGCELKPFYMGNVKYNTFQFLGFYASLFKGHHIMSNYAKSCGVHITNRTKNSLIDAYERKK